MGLKAEAVGENDNLAALGIDSMQLMEVRAVMQKKLCRPIPLEMIGSLTVATLRELASEAGSKGGRSSAPPAEEVSPVPRLMSLYTQADFVCLMHHSVGTCSAAARGAVPLQALHSEPLVALNAHRSGVCAE